jgi:hypothetical protein
MKHSELRVRAKLVLGLPLVPLPYSVRHRPSASETSRGPRWLAVSPIRRFALSILASPHQGTVV